MKEAKNYKSYFLKNIINVFINWRIEFYLTPLDQLVFLY